jgi:phospholipid-binding lipoprotein MlaA
MRMLAGVCAVALLAGGASAQTADAPPPAEPRDRFEGFNRAVWGFNQTVDRVALKPVSTVYRTVTPRPARRGITRIFANLAEPWSAINNLLQGRPGRAVNNLGRFVVNTTIGVGGLAITPPTLA